MDMYKIPDEINERIPEYFYLGLGGELVSVFGATVLIRDEDGFSTIDYLSSTGGYVAAFETTCRKLDMMWLFEYWNTLEWYNSDIFDGEMCCRVVDAFESDMSCNAYYKYLANKVNQREIL